jgi:hypothetical protein
MAPAAAGFVPRLCGEWLDWTPDQGTEVARKTARSTRADEAKPVALPETPAMTDVADEIGDGPAELVQQAAEAAAADAAKAVEYIKQVTQSAAQITQAVKDAVKAAADSARAAADSARAAAEAQQAPARLPMSLVVAFVTVAIMCVIVVCITAITLACRQGKE